MKKMHILVISIFVITHNVFAATFYLVNNTNDSMEMSVYVGDTLSLSRPRIHPTFVQPNQRIFVNSNLAKNIYVKWTDDDNVDRIAVIPLSLLDRAKVEKECGFDDMGGFFQTLTSNNVVIKNPFEIP